MRRPNQNALRHKYEQATLGYRHAFYLLSETEGRLVERIIDALTSEEFTPDPKDLLDLIEYRRKNYAAEGNCDCCGKDIESVGEDAYLTSQMFHGYENPEQPEPRVCSARCEHNIFQHISTIRTIAEIFRIAIPEQSTKAIWFEVEAIVNPDVLNPILSIQLLAVCPELRTVPVLDLHKQADWLLSGYADELRTERIKIPRVVITFRTTKKLLYKIWQIELRGIAEAQTSAEFTLTDCPACNGTGHVICTNPDHGSDGDQSPQGCPAYGHDELCRTPDPCEFCTGQGTLVVQEHRQPASVTLTGGYLTITDDLGTTAHRDSTRLVNYVNFLELVAEVGHILPAV